MSDDMIQTIEWHNGDKVAGPFSDAEMDLEAALPDVKLVDVGTHTMWMRKPVSEFAFKGTRVPESC